MGNSLNNQATTLLADLARRGIRLEPRGDQLAYFPRSKVTPDLRSRLQNCKSDLLNLLNGTSTAVSREPSRSLSRAFSALETGPSSSTVSVIIPVERDDRYLESAVLSAIGQTHPPCEVLIVDATGIAGDNAPDFAGVRLLRVESPKDCLLAGVRESRGEYLLFLAAHNLISRDYLRSALTAFDNRYVGAVYSDHRLFGGESGQTAYPDEVDHNDLARSDIAHLAAVIRRDALVSLDAWDWQTLLSRLARLKWKLRKQTSTLLVRNSERDRSPDYFERQALAQAEITLFIPLSGREHTWNELHRFLERQTWPHNQIKLVLCDTSQHPEFTRCIKEWIAECDYSDVRHFSYSPAQSGLADEPRNGRLQAVNETMCRIYNRLRTALETDYCWILEDDIIPPDDVLQRLLQQFDEQVACVSAPYRSRFDGRFLVWDRERAGNGGVHRIDRPPADRPQVQEVRGSGFGCLVVRSECLERHVFSLPAGERWYDPYFFKSLGDRWRRRVDWTCECRHLHNAPRPGTEITRRNLIYHITPFASNDVWLRNVRQVLQRIELFNGRRVVAIAAGEWLVNPEDVKRAFDGYEVEFLVLPNSRRLRENATFLPLLESVDSADPAEATFYAHAKGVSTVGDVRGVTCWRNAMYHELLDDWPKVADLLSQHAVVGTHRRRHDDNPGIFPDGQSRATWHFSGTFFWFRNRDVFTTQRWRDEWQPTGWGVEAWPGSMFPFDRSACVAFEGLANPYDPNCYPNPIPDEEDTMSTETAPALASDALKIELGGGDSPRGEGYLNLDKRALPAVDHVCDFETDDLPFEDDSVRAVYSSHCFEHFTYGRVLREIARVCEIGAYVEIKVPHWLSENALIQGHRHTFGPEEVERITGTAIDCYWNGCPKRLKHTGTEYVPSRHFEEASALFPHMNDEQVLRYVPNACYEIKYTFHVIENA